MSTAFTQKTNVYPIYVHALSPPFNHFDQMGFHIECIELAKANVLSSFAKYISGTYAKARLPPILYPHTK